MAVLRSILYDPASGIEIPFFRPLGTKRKYENQVVEYIRARDDKLVSWVASAGVRQIEFQMKTANSPDMERTLDYFRTAGTTLLLMLPTSYFASEIIIKEVDLVEVIDTYQTFNVSAYCYGVEGMSVCATDPLCYGEPALTQDVDAVGGLASPLYEIYHDIQGFETVTDDVYMPQGSWNIIIRAKSTNGTANDLLIRAHDPISHEFMINGTKTVTKGTYKYYLANGAVDSNNINHGVQIYASKATATTNTILVDLIAYVHASGSISV